MSWAEAMVHPSAALSLPAATGDSGSPVSCWTANLPNEDFHGASRSSPNVLPPSESLSWHTATVGVHSALNEHESQLRNHFGGLRGGVSMHH